MMKMRHGIAFAALAANLLTGNAMSGGPSKADACGKYAEVNGLRLYYEEHGAGGVPLVLMHGGGSTIETSFGKVLGGYAKTRRVIAFEQQGHGRTADVDRPFSFEQSAEDAVALLKSLGIDKADFLGYSNGGHIAIEIALRRPEVVRRLVIESAMFDRSGSDPGFWESFKTAKLEDMPKELREAYVRVAPRPEDLPVHFTKSVRRMSEFKGWTPDQIRSIKAPTLVLVGDADIVHPEHAAAMFRLLPRGRLAVLPGVDHMMIVDRADLLLAVVLPFLDAPEAP